jgi:hypothetical protein
MDDHGPRLKLIEWTIKLPTETCPSLELAAWELGCVCVRPKYSPCRAAVELTPRPDARSVPGGRCRF